MPLAKMAALLRERFGLTVTPGGLVQVLHRAARVAAPTYAALCAQIRGSPVVSPDETGWRVGAVRHWLWAFATPETRCIAFATGAASTRRPRCWAPTLTASWCETGGRRIAASRRRCIRRVWRTWCAERAPCPRIIRAVRGQPACRRSSPTPSHSVIDGRRTRSPSTACRGPRAPARAPRTTPRHGARPAGRPALRRPSRPRVRCRVRLLVGARGGGHQLACRTRHSPRRRQPLWRQSDTPGRADPTDPASVIRTARQRLVDLTELFTTLLRSPRPTVPKALQAPPR